MPKPKAFMYKWLIAIGLGLLCIVLGVVVGGIVLKEIIPTLFFILQGIFVISWFMLLVPYGFCFSKEEIVIYYTFRKKLIRIKDITSCDLQESGIRTYPWGCYYHIIVNKPFTLDQVKIPQNPIADYWIAKYKTT
ncbi:MAG: hypothetical protein IJW19_03400 [Clostridia bacterium]|nr:hypothetical protein [Clostridia bacterium]